MKMHMIPNRRDPPPYSSTDPLQATNGITNDRYTYLNKYNFSEIPTVIVNLIRSYIKLKVGHWSLLWWNRIADYTF